MNVNFDIHLPVGIDTTVYQRPPAHPIMPSTDQAWGEPLRLLSLGK